MKRLGLLVESDLTGWPCFDGSLGVWFGGSELHVRDVVDTIARPALAFELDLLLMDEVVEGQ